MRTADTPPTTKSHLLQLPAELRLEIYEHYMCNVHWNLDEYDSRTIAPPPLLEVCKLIRKEGVPVYETFLPRSPEDAKEHIRGRMRQLAELREERDKVAEFLDWVAIQHGRIKPLEELIKRYMSSLAQYEMLYEKRAKAMSKVR